MTTRGIRGAIAVGQNSAKAVLSATRELLVEISAANPDLEPEDIASIFFTVTPDLTETYPALAARQLGWVEVPLLCAQEIPVPDGLPGVIRVLVHWNTHLQASEIRHVYLGDAAALRPDLNIPVRNTLSIP